MFSNKHQAIRWCTHPSITLCYWLSLSPNYFQMKQALYVSELMLVFTDFIDLSGTTFTSESWNGSGCSQIIPKPEVFLNSCEKLFYQPKIFTKPVSKNVKYSYANILNTAYSVLQDARAAPSLSLLTKLCLFSPTQTLLKLPPHQETLIQSVLCPILL